MPIGNPSGMAATATATAVKNISEISRSAVIPKTKIEREKRTIKTPIILLK